MIELTVIAPDGYDARKAIPTEGPGHSFFAEASELGLPAGMWPHTLSAIAANGGAEQVQTLRMAGVNRGPDRWDSPILSVIYEAGDIRLEVWND